MDADRRLRCALARFSRPFTNGQVERINQTIKDATVKRVHYEPHDELCAATS
ncbi:hypothetical protein ICI42_13295 [Tianweitania sp. Rool2]|uniref:Uncharacterized protein n=1 Tax=Oryzicola mucosus TaxID=2767425 RepID=A0A8J6PU38_9HYPH|nr:hypothetical protein [Oryzicola mucosus]